MKTRSSALKLSLYRILSLYLCSSFVFCDKSCAYLPLQPKLTLLGCVDVWFSLNQHDGRREFVNKLFRVEEMRVLTSYWNFHTANLWSPGSRRVNPPLLQCRCPDVHEQPWVSRLHKALQSQILSSVYTPDQWLCFSTSRDAPWHLPLFFFLNICLCRCFTGVFFFHFQFKKIQCWEDRFL